jgi:c-di-GMP-binding flagellar brake protein YcgR
MDRNQAREDNISASGAYRSALDIARILEDLARDRIQIEADLGNGDDERPFVSTILHVEPDISHFVVAYVENDEINSLLYRQATIKFSAAYQGDHLNFFARTPLDGAYLGKPAIYFPLPESMHRYRRTHERLTVPAEAGLRCFIGYGAARPLELRVLDISEGGVGCLGHTDRDPFAAGTTFQNCTFTLPGGQDIRATLAVQYAMPTMLANGTYALRLGLRFVTPTEALRALARKFAR